MHVALKIKHIVPAQRNITKNRNYLICGGKLCHPLLIYICKMVLKSSACSNDLVALTVSKAVGLRSFVLQCNNH